MSKIIFTTKSKSRIFITLFSTKLQKIYSRSASVTIDVLKSMNLKNHLVTIADGTIYVVVNVHDINDHEKIGRDIAKAVLELELEQASLDLDLEDVIIADIAASIQEYTWSFSKYKTGAVYSFKELQVICNKPSDMNEYYKRHEALITGINICKTLAVEPANVMDPENFANTCLQLREHGIEVEVFSKPQLQALGMNALLGVAQGSSKEPKMVVMRYIHDASSSENIAFVGKGVCFDSGGLFVKDQKSMPMMKYDKSGAAAVVGAILAIAKQKLKTNVIGIVGLVENMPDGNAQRPSDVIKSMSGKTIEVADTDAEGRLVLADCLYYTHKNFNPKIIITVATLTYATIVCLANQYAGLFTRDDNLANKLILAGNNTGDRLWRLPLGDTFKHHIESDIADVRNLGREGFGENAAAAEFLHEFVGGSVLAHLDTAGVSWYTEEENLLGYKGATGYGVKLLHDFIAKLP